MSTNYHTPIPGLPAQPEATSELFNSRFSSLDSGISGKVDSTGNGSNITSEVSVAGTRRNLTSGGTLKVIFSEIQKWLSDMKAVAFSASYNDLINRPTTMTPTAHAATHKTGGSDALKAVDIGAVSEVLPGSNVTVSKNPDTGAVTINAAGGGSGGSAHIIANDGAALPNQGTLDFGVGLAAADDPATFKTAVSLDMGAIQIGKAQISDFPAIPTVPNFETDITNIKADGIASVGVLMTVARSDHVHPVIDSGWLDIILQNGWSLHTHTKIAKYRKYGGIISVEGLIAGGSATSAIFGVLPPGFRPLVRHNLSGIRNDTDMIPIRVESTGILRVLVPTYGSYIWFSGSWIATN